MHREPGVGTEPDRARLVRVPRLVSQRWLLTDPYLDLVWAAHLGPTATLVARHLGHALARSLTEIDLAELGAFIGRSDDRVGGRRHVTRALARLSAARIVSWSPQQATITLTGYIAPASPELLARLPVAVAAMHERLQAAADATVRRTTAGPTVDAAHAPGTQPRSVQSGGRARHGGFGR